MVRCRFAGVQPSIVALGNVYVKQQQKSQEQRLVNLGGFDGVFLDGLFFKSKS